MEYLSHSVKDQNGKSHLTEQRLTGNTWLLKDISTLGHIGSVPSGSVRKADVVNATELTSCLADGVLGKHNYPGLLGRGFHDYNQNARAVHDTYYHDARIYLEERNRAYLAQVSMSNYGKRTDSRDGTNRPTENHCDIGLF